MTYDPNDPRRAEIRDRIDAERRGPGGAILGGILALLLFLGVMFWAFSGPRNVALNPTATTTGQRVDPPQTVPAPAPAPRPVPAPAPQAQ